MLGLDYSAGTIPGSVIKAAGYDFVVRYVGTPGRRKNITKSEFNDLVANGVTVWLVYENDVNDAMGGFSGGQAAARAARADANAVGYPPGGVIFFCSDRHLTRAEIPTALSYLDGAADVLGHGAVGAYGFWEYLDADIARPQRGAAYYWQCGIAPAPEDPKHIWQRNDRTTTVGGVACDINELIRPIGGSAPIQGEPDMLLTDGWTDEFGNHQDVQTTLNRVNELWNAFFGASDLRNMITDTGVHAAGAHDEATAAHAELTRLYQSEVPGSTYMATAGQMATNADAYGYELASKVNALEAKLDAVIHALNSVVIAPK